VRLAIATGLLAASVTAGLAQPVPTDLVVIIDSDSPVAQGETADRLRDAALAALDPNLRVASYQLTTGATTTIPSLDSETLRSLHFEPLQRTYSGVSMTITEAVEIQRGNEPVREDIVRRSCPQRTGCSGLVHAAAVALVDDTDAAAAKKMHAIGEIVRSTRAKTLVLVTAGWPARPARLRLDEAIRNLDTAGTSLVVWRLPASVTYGALVQDTVDEMATRLHARQLSLRDAREAEQARSMFAQAPTPAAGVVTSAPSSDASPPPKADEGFSAAGMTDATLRRAVAYVDSFERTFAAVMWRERYQQEATTRMRFNASGGRFTVPAGRRVLESELLLVWLPADASWLAVRDVISVDGVATADAERRVPRALGGPPISVAELKQLASENGRYNIGRIVHTFNEPTFALLLLDAQHRRRFSFRRGKRDSVGARRAVTYEFVERTRPTLIKDRNRDVPARGTLWLDEATGQVLQTSLELEQKEEGLRGAMTVRYGPHPQFDVLVPAEMRESYVSTSGEEIATVATYSNFRRFETAGRIIIPQ
jgi:hypothetical protein